MKRNLILNSAVTFCNIINLIIILMFLGWTFLFVHLQIDKDYYKNKEVNLNNLGFTYSLVSKWKVNNKSLDKDVYEINKIKTTSIYILYLQYSISLILIFLSFKEFQKVLSSVKRIQTFEINNEISFRRIGQYTFVYFLLTSFRYISFELGGLKAITISLTPIIILLLAFIMAEIFKEGSLLKQENDLTI
ncbi:DUF2975 domain-containing protein [uncultured Algibacter sp.]|uniref:DUF2975 domain-containing protein n=1 Tax=uncultured Algibacter sp. TaxID=298659 RepID=UPI00321786C0